jgi:nucleotide-binding universal stress UspA family protein
MGGHLKKNAMKHILVPTDFSSCAGAAADAAITISQKSHSDILFLHYMSIPTSWLQLDSGHDKIYPDITQEVNEATENLKALVARAKDKGVESDFFLAFNESTSNISRYIQEQVIDMVIMGSHGASGVRELFIGSNAQRIVRQSPVPVLIIKNEMSHIENVGLTFVSDFEAESIKPFEQLLNVAEVLEAKVNLVYFNTPAYFVDTWEIEQRMESFEFMAGKQLGSIDIINTYVFEDGLVRYTEEQENPIIAMATHGRHGVSRVFYGSVTEKAVNHLSVPVLSMKISSTVHEAYPDTTFV